MKTSTVNWLIGAAITLAIVVAVVVVIKIDTVGKKGSRLGDEFGYDVSHLRQTARELVQYKETQKIETGLKEARGIAVGPEDRVYVAGDREIRVFRRDGVAVSEVRLGDSPRCLAVDTDGTSYVGFKGHVEVYDPQGKREAAWKSIGPSALVTSVAVSKADVFVADAGDRVVLRYDKHGNLTNRIGEKNPEKGAPGLRLPSPFLDVGITPNGLLSVQNPGRHRVEIYTFDGSYKSSWGKASMQMDGFCGCCNPTHFAVLPDGRFVTSEKGLPRVKVYDARGEFLAVVATPEDFAEHAKGLDVATDSQSRVLVLDPTQRAVRVFVESGG